MIILTNGSIFEGLNDHEKSQGEPHEESCQDLCEAVLSEDDAARTHHPGNDEYHTEPPVGVEREKKGKVRLSVPKERIAGLLNKRILK